MNFPLLAKIAPFSPIESATVWTPDFKSSLRPDMIASSVGFDMPARALNSARLGLHDVWPRFGGFFKRFAAGVYGDVQPERL